VKEEHALSMKHPPQPALWIIMISWNNRDDVLQCLKALQQQTYPNLHLVLIDNASQDGTASAVRKQFPSVHLFKLSHNYGFARAANVGMRFVLAAEGSYVLLFNVDTYFEPDLLEQLIRQMEQYPQLGIISPKIYLHQKPDYLWAVGGKVTPTRLHIYGYGEPDHGQYDACSLDFVMGCAMLMRAKVLQQIGLLDGRFFVFYEEIDLCLRAKTAGWQIAFLPNVQMYHESETSTRGHSYIRHFYMARSRFLFFWKYRFVFNLSFLFAYELGHTASIVFRHVVRGDVASGWAYLYGTLIGLTRKQSLLNAPYETLVKRQLGKISI
jgi:GT2 family glycosyltransferase